MDHATLSGRIDSGTATGLASRLQQVALKHWLSELKQVATDTNALWADKLGIPHSKQLTLVKPSGTVSQLCGTASGIHPRFSPYYFRRVTQDNKDPLTDMMISEGVPHVVSGEKVVFSFPVKSPEGSICAREMGAIQQLEIWKTYYDYWCDGNPSQTVYYTDDEFLDLQSWVWKNWDSVGGLSFFPLDDFVYDKATQPYLEVTEEEYLEALERFPKDINWDSLPEYEAEDNTTSSQEMACQGGSCEL